MGWTIALSHDDNVYSITTPMVVNDSKKNLLHNDKQIQCKIANNIVNTYINIIIMQLPRQNDSHTHDQCILHDAQKNLVVIDF